MFKVGEIVLMMHSTKILDSEAYLKAYMGTEVRITEIYDGLPFEHSAKDQWYKVNSFDDASFYAAEKILQKLPPGTWENVAKLTGWNPTKVKINA